MLCNLILAGKWDMLMCWWYSWVSICFHIIPDLFWCFEAGLWTSPTSQAAWVCCVCCSRCKLHCLQIKRYLFLFRVTRRSGLIVLLAKLASASRSFVTGLRDYELHQRSIENLSKLLDGWWKGKSHLLGHKLWTLISLLKQEREIIP